MLRAIDVILICGLIGSASWTYKVKYDAHIALERVEELEKKIIAERAEIKLLKADWALYNSPARLQRLVDKYRDELNLVPLDPGQISTVDQLPPLRSERIERKSPMLDGFAEADRTVKTGSVPLAGGLKSRKIN
ncbi:MAG: hypothetical protein COB78_02605 [Hyphomicrobiales bacterium]|nr:MAG: hypothetical protein COB78_02605 [Hyphomicrobiales bacterium]